MSHCTLTLTLTLTLNLDGDLTGKFDGDGDEIRLPFLILTLIGGKFDGDGDEIRLFGPKRTGEGRSSIRAF